MLVERGAGVFFREDAFQARVVALDRDHGVVDDLADLGLLGAVLEIGPARAGWNPENIFRAILIGIFRVGAFSLREVYVFFLERVGDVFEKDQAEDDVLVFGRVHVDRSLSAASQSLASKPRLAVELFFEEERARGICGSHRSLTVGQLETRNCPTQANRRKGAKSAIRRHLEFFEPPRPGGREVASVLLCENDLVAGGR